MGLSTHILDLVTGQPAAGVRVTVSLDGTPNGEAITDEDGRCPALIGEDALQAGRYELVFHVGAYLKPRRESASDALFYDDIPVQFLVSDTGRHYHVPLLLSPFGYSTYRGS